MYLRTTTGVIVPETLPVALHFGHSHLSPWLSQLRSEAVAAARDWS